jgi:hypothetical protein
MKKYSGWGYSSIIGYLHNMHEALGSISNTIKRRKVKLVKKITEFSLCPQNF